MLESSKAILESQQYFFPREAILDRWMLKHRIIIWQGLEVLLGGRLLKLFLLLILGVVLLHGVLGGDVGSVGIQVQQDVRLAVGDPLVRLLDERQQSLRISVLVRKMLGQDDVVVVLVHLLDRLVPIHLHLIWNVLLRVVVVLLVGIHLRIRNNLTL